MNYTYLILLSACITATYVVFYFGSEALDLSPYTLSIQSYIFDIATDTVSTNSTPRRRPNRTATAHAALLTSSVSTLASFRSQPASPPAVGTCPNSSVDSVGTDFLARYPFFLACRQNYSVWSPTSKTSGEEHNADYDYDYSKPASYEMQSRRVLRGILIYYPLDKSKEYMLEFKWFYRSWIEMLQHEPSAWRTDLLIFVQHNRAVFNDTHLFLSELNCSFAHRRRSPHEPPMCTLIAYEPLSKRTLPPLGAAFKALRPQHRYEHLLTKIDIFNDTVDNYAAFLHTVKQGLSSYSYLDSILMAFDGYAYFTEAGFDFLIRSDMDVFLTPLFGKWLPRNCNDFYVGRGGYSTVFNNNRLQRIAANLKLKHAGVWNLGSTWFSTPEQFRFVSYLTLFGMAYLSAEEFTQPERANKLGILLWPDWHYGVLLLYGQNLALNHLLALRQLNVVKLENHFDFPSANTEPIAEKLHIHVFHGDDLFSKFQFKAGKYDSMASPNATQASLVKYYALRIALEAKRTSNLELTRLLATQTAKKI